MKQKRKKKNRVVAYLDGEEDSIPETDAELMKWIKKYLSAKDKRQKKNKVS